MSLSQLTQSTSLFTPTDRSKAHTIGSHSNESTASESVSATRTSPASTLPAFPTRPPAISSPDKSKNQPMHQSMHQSSSTSAIPSVHTNLHYRTTTPVSTTAPSTARFETQAVVRRKKELSTIITTYTTKTIAIRTLPPSSLTTSTTKTHNKPTNTHTVPSPPNKLVSKNVKVSDAPATTQSSVRSRLLPDIKPSPRPNPKNNKTSPRATKKTI